MGAVEDRALTVAGHLNAAHIELVEFVADVLRDESWGVDGIRSPEHWLGWQLGLSSAEARRAVTIARAFDTHPVLCGMFRTGRLSIAQTAVAVTVDPTRDAELAELAVVCTLNQLRLFAKAMRIVDTTTPAESPDDGKIERLQFTVADDGWMDGRFVLNPEHTQLVKAALEQCRHALFHQHEPTEPVASEAAPPTVPSRVRWVDTFVELAHRGLDAETSTVRRDRFRINIYLDIDNDQRASWIDRGRVPAWLADKLTCDGRLTPTFTRHSIPLSVGRSMRIVPERTRRAVTHRDQGQCRIPWCDRTIGLDVHHIIHWLHGGPTDTDNLMLVCNHCHDDIHTGRLHVSGNADQPDGLEFSDKFGRLRELHPKPPAGNPPPDPANVYQHPLGERLRRDDVWVNPTKLTRTGEQHASR